MPPRGWEQHTDSAGYSLSSGRMFLPSNLESQMKVAEPRVGGQGRAPGPCYTVHPSDIVEPAQDSSQGCEPSWF